MHICNNGPSAGPKDRAPEAIVPMIRSGRNGVVRLACGVLLAAAAAGAAAAEKFEGLVVPYLEVQLSSAVPGIIEEVLVDRGDFVKKDQILVRLKSDVERASYELAKARAAFAGRKVVRNEELYRRQMISIHEKDEMETERELLRLELGEIEERLKLRSIQSPLDGVVVRRFFSPGEFVGDQPILALARIDPLRVEVVVPVSFYGKIQVGMTATIDWEVPVGGVHRAKVTVVDPVVDAASGTIGVRLELPNPKGHLPAGTKCRVTLPVAAGAR
jgi:RND family efflux transporter MFP subunit